MKLFLKIYGMDCAACAGQVTSVLRKAPGIDRVRVNFSTSGAELEVQNYPDFSLLEKRLARLGYALPKEKVTVKTNNAAFDAAQERIAAQLPAFAYVEKSAGTVTLFLYPVGCRGNEVLAAFRSVGVRSGGAAA